MSETSKDWVLPNGFTFIASTAGWYGSWAKATDPVTAARNAAKNASGSYPQWVQIWYAPDETTNITEMGSLSWKAETADKIVPIGFFELTKSTMKPSHDPRLTHQEFMADNINQFEKSHEMWNTHHG